jgi:zinc protease
VLSHKTDALQAIKYLEKIVCDLNIDEELLSQEKEIISEEMGGLISWNYRTKKLSLLGFPEYVVHPTIGTRYSLKNIKISDIQKFYEQFYTPDNIVLSIVGNFNRKEIVDFVNKHFINLPKVHSNRPNKIQFLIKGPKIKARREIWGYSFTVYFVTKAFENADLPVAELMNEYIDLQMHKNFRMKKEQLYHIGCDLDYEYNIGCFDFDFRCKHKKLKRVLFDFLKDLKLITNNCIDEKMLDTIKNKLIKKQLIFFENVLQAAEWYSNRELLTSKDNPNDLESYLKSFDDITCESITDFAKRLFTPSNFFLDYDGFLNKKSKEEILNQL